MEACLSLSLQIERELHLSNSLSLRGCFIHRMNFLGFSCRISASIQLIMLAPNSRGWGEGVLTYKGLMGTCGQPGYVFRDFCLEQGIEFIIFCLNQGIDLSIFVLNWVKCLKRGIKNRNSLLNRVGKSAIFVLNRVRV